MNAIDDNAKGKTRHSPTSPKKKRKGSEASRESFSPPVSVTSAVRGGGEGGSELEKGERGRETERVRKRDRERDRETERQSEGDKETKRQRENWRGEEDLHLNSTCTMYISKGY